MNLYRITFARMPTKYNPRRVLFVRAANDVDALAVAHQHVEHNDGIAYSEYVWLGVELAAPDAPGHVVSITVTGA